jgi:hypothetical protein
MKNRIRNRHSLAVVIALLLSTFIHTGFAGQPGSPAIAALPQAAGEVKLPDTPAAKTFAAFLKALNSGDLEVMKKFHKEYAGNLENANKDFDFYQQSGGIKLVGINQASDYALELVVQTKNDSERLTFTIEVAKTAPHAITSIRIQPA